MADKVGEWGRREKAGRYKQVREGVRAWTKVASVAKTEIKRGEANRYENWMKRAEKRKNGGGRKRKREKKNVGGRQGKNKNRWSGRNKKTRVYVRSRKKKKHSDKEELTAALLKRDGQMRARIEEDRGVPRGETAGGGGRGEGGKSYTAEDEKYERGKDRQEKEERDSKEKFM